MNMLALQKNLIVLWSSRFEKKYVVKSSIFLHSTFSIILQVFPVEKSYKS